MTRLAGTGTGALGSRALVATLLLALEGARREGVDLSLSGLRDRIREEANADPLAAVTKVVVLSATLFYAAEHGKNEKVHTFADALLYCTTSLSVGYHDIFPRTQAGKAIASLLHTIGPSLTARAFDEPNREQESRAHEDAVLKKLEEIAASLKTR